MSLITKVGDTLIFYSMFCVTCNDDWIGTKMYEPCPHCGKIDQVLGIKGKYDPERADK